MSDLAETSIAKRTGTDLDAVETSEWVEALDAVVAHDGPDRARPLLTRVVERAQHAGTGGVREYDAIECHILEMADMLSSGIVEHFPGRFR